MVRLTQAALRARKYKADWEYERAKARTKRKKKYYKYLKSEQWKKRKRKLIKSWRCEVCGSRKNLHVHHRSYKNIFHEKKRDLMVLCETCHKIWHSMESPTKKKVRVIRKAELISASV